MKNKIIKNVLIVSVMFFVQACGNSSSSDSSDNQVLSFNEIQQINNSISASQDQEFTSEGGGGGFQVTGSDEVYTNNGNGSNFQVTGVNPPAPRPNNPTTPNNPNQGGEDDDGDFSTRVLNFRDGGEGNLWKPVSENNGNLVVLFNPSFRRVFSGGCVVQLRNGSFSPLFCGGALNCFTNPNRLTLRSNVRCSEVSEVKVTCNDDNGVVIFTVPSANRGDVCGRHD